MKVGFLRGLAVIALAVAGGVSPLLSHGAAAQTPPLTVPVIRLASGATPADITPAIEQFRADLGGANNGAGAPADSGRREINWDGVPDSFSSPNAFPPDFFNRNSPRGAVFSTPGTGFQNSAKADNPTNTPVRFGNIDPSYTDAFSVFSPERIFTPVGSNVMDVHFFVPGTDTPATVSGFGAVFTDVDLPGTTIEYFDAAGRSLGRWLVPVSPNGGLSFLGVSYRSLSPQGFQGIARVRIISGNTALKAGVLDRFLTDLVVMDDFIYGEPRALTYGAS
jgi:hypothetical protein